MSIVITSVLAAFVLAVGFFVPRPMWDMPPSGFDQPDVLFPQGRWWHGSGCVICTFAYGFGAFAVATGDTKNPEKDVPRAVFGFALGQTIFFVLPTLALVLAIPWTLISTMSSPFVVALQHLNIPAGGSILNAVVLIASFSVLVASMFSSVIMLASLAETGRRATFWQLERKKWRSMPC